MKPLGDCMKAQLLPLPKPALFLSIPQMFIPRLSRINVLHGNLYFKSLFSGEPYQWYYYYFPSESGSRTASHIGNSHNCSQEITLWIYSGDKIIIISMCQLIIRTFQVYWRMGLLRTNYINVISQRKASFWIPVIYQLSNSWLILNFLECLHTCQLENFCLRQLPKTPPTLWSYY